MPSLAQYPQHTAKLAELLAALLSTREALRVVSLTLQPGSIANLPEYQTALLAYRAYWAEVDNDRQATKASCHPALPNC